MVSYVAGKLAKGRGAYAELVRPVHAVEQYIADQVAVEQAQLLVLDGRAVRGRLCALDVLVEDRVDLSAGDLVRLRDIRGVKFAVEERAQDELRPRLPQTEELLRGRRPFPVDGVRELCSVPSERGLACGRRPLIVLLAAALAFFADRREFIDRGADLLNALFFFRDERGDAALDKLSLLRGGGPRTRCGV